MSVKLLKKAEGQKLPKKQLFKSLRPTALDLVL